jgi:hypothetical protein
MTATLTETFNTGFHGTVVTPADDEYAAAREVWNGMISTRPALIAKCHTVDEIVEAVRLGRDSGRPVAVRGGGHSVAGLSSCDGGVVIDLDEMRGVTVDPERRLAFVEPGTTWGEYDRATAAHGLASTGGLISTTGIAGLTLGGGLGWLQRKYGLACDNLIEADVVTADGRIVHTSESDRPELLAGLRGGGGNFGVVTNFTFALHPVSTVLGGLMAFPLARAREVLRTFRDWAPGLPDDGSMLAALLSAPPEPFVPDDLVGQPIAAILGCWCGDLDEGAAALAPMKELSPAIDMFGPMPYPALNSMLDNGAPAGQRNYMRGGFVDDLSDEVIDVALNHAVRMRSPKSQIHFHQMGGAVAREPAGGSTFSGRDAGYTYNLLSIWTEEAEDDMHINANRAAATALAPFATDGAYVNFQTDHATGGSGDDRVRFMYGTDLYDRLARLKREYDPTNLFRINQNIHPAR